MSEPAPRIRKSLVALAGTEERKGYFYCLKMLGILPVPPNSGLDQWTAYTPSTQPTQSFPKPFQYYTPKCLHDVLINSHATSCEHSNFYFSFYHRHLTVLCEIFLNFAHQVLKGGLAKLTQVYTSAQIQEVYTGKEAQWENVFSTYQSWTSIPNQVANHYWNPTNYLQNKDLIIPDELAAKVASTEPIDLLFLAINKAYPWQVHTPRRWYNKECSYKRYDLEQRQILDSTPVTFTDEDNKFIAGNLDPRKNPDTYEPSKDFLSEHVDRIYYMTIYRNTFDFDNVKKNYRLNYITADESLSNYGARSKNLQYITQAEKQQYNLSAEMVQSYNHSIPHFQYAYSLFALKMSRFIEDPKERRSVEAAHNFMHNNFGYILNDSNFSVSSLVFYPYHSWIDAMVEIKLRRGNQEGNAEDEDYLRNTLNNKYSVMLTATAAKLNKVFGTIKGEMEPMSNWKLSGDDQINEDSAGIYPVLEWVSPTMSATSTEIPISPAFCARDFVLTKTKIRDSLNFNQIYQNYYAKYYQQRYSFFDNLQGFNFNYNYQIGSRPSDLANILDEFGENIPQYLKDMEKDIRTRDPIGPIDSFAESAFASRQESASLLKTGPRLRLKAEKLKLRKLFESGAVKIFVEHPSNIKNGSYPIRIKLRNALEDLYKKMPPKDLERYIQNGIRATDFFIFGKEHASAGCHKCLKTKTAFIDVENDLRLRAPAVWKYLVFNSLNEVYYDSNEEVELKSIADKLLLVAVKGFTDTRLVSGAQEIVIDIDTELDGDNVFVRFDADSYSVRQNVAKAVVSKKQLSFDTKFDFYKLFDVDMSVVRTEFDHFVYKRLRGWISYNNKRAEFAISIPNFQRLLRLTLKVDLVDEKLHVRLVDSDFAIKRAYYESLSSKE